MWRFGYASKALECHENRKEARDKLCRLWSAGSFTMCHLWRVATPSRRQTEPKRINPPKAQTASLITTTKTSMDWPNPIVCWLRRLETLVVGRRTGTTLPNQRKSAKHGTSKASRTEPRKSKTTLWVFKGFQDVFQLVCAGIRAIIWPLDSF